MLTRFSDMTTLAKIVTSNQNIFEHLFNYIFECKQNYYLDNKLFALKHRKSTYECIVTHLQYFHYTFLIVCDIYCLKNFTVFSAPKLSN